MQAEERGQRTEDSEQLAGKKDTGTRRNGEPEIRGQRSEIEVQNSREDHQN
jgi:hypothetical protein